MANLHIQNKAHASTEMYTVSVVIVAATKSSDNHLKRHIVDYIQLVSQQGLGRTSCCLSRHSPQLTVKANFCLTVFLTNRSNTAELMRRHQEAGHKLNRRQNNKLCWRRQNLNLNHLENTPLSQLDLTSSHSFTSAALLICWGIPHQPFEIQQEASSALTTSSVFIAHHLKQPHSLN